MGEPAGAALGPAHPTHNNAWYTSLPVAARIALLNEWFALVEVGWVSAQWSTLGQRLDYARECARKTPAAWCRKAVVGLSTLANYTTGQRGMHLNPQVPLDPKMLFTIAQLVVASEEPIELPWVLFGSRPWMQQHTIGDRCAWALESRFGESAWVEKAKEMKLYSVDFRTKSPDKATRRTIAGLAKDIAAALGPSVSLNWLQTGITSAPPAITALAEEFQEEIDDPASRVESEPDIEFRCRPSIAFELMRLVDAHRHELSPRVVDAVYAGLQVPLIERGLYVPWTDAEHDAEAGSRQGLDVGNPAATEGEALDAPRLEERIRDQRFELVMHAKRIRPEDVMRRDRTRPNG